MKSNPPTPSSSGELLTILRANPTAIPWSQRVEAAKRLQDRLEAGGAVAEIVDLLELLAADPKPEVRQVVAYLITLLSDEDFARVAPKLENDSHYYVRRTVERAVKKRQQAQKAASRRRLGFDEIAQELRQIESAHGIAAGRAAWHLCERYTQLLIGSMVHDLRSILNHLRGNVVTLAAAAEKAGTQPRVGQRVRNDVDFLERTVLDMERFTTSPRNKMSAKRLVDLVQSAREQADAAVRSDAAIDPAQVTLDIQIPESITVRVVSHMIVAALGNVIKNAFEAFVQHDMGAVAPVISIHAVASKGWAQLVIRDNGKGFAPEEAAALKPFTPGRRNKTKKNSTGYGLPNAMRNISAHGGTVQIDSKEDRGTIITIRLPLPAEPMGERP